MKYDSKHIKCSISIKLFPDDIKRNIDRNALFYLPEKLLLTMIVNDKQHMRKLCSQKRTKGKNPKSEKSPLELLRLYQQILIPRISVN